jgi:hypothetical protein
VFLISAVAMAARGSAPPSLAPAAEGTPPILVGDISRADLREPPFGDWFEGQYARYQPTEASLQGLKELLPSLSIEAYFGTWCGDSKRQVPRLLRLLDLAGFDEKRLTLVGLSDRPMEFKQAPGNPERRRRIHRTPTIVVVRDGVEIGRIVETPTTTLEGDLLDIARGHAPEPRYGAEAWVHHLFTDLPPDQAIKALETGEGEVLKRGSPDSLWHYAEHDLLKNGRAREAKAVLDLHLKLNPRSIDGLILMADALNSLGRRTEAVNAIERALIIEPGNRRALRMAETLKNP